MNINNYKNYNNVKSYFLWETPLNKYHTRFKAVFDWKNLSCSKLPANLFVLITSPLAYPLFGAVSLAGRAAKAAWAQCNPSVRSGAVKTIQTAREKQLAMREPPVGPIKMGYGEYVVYKSKNGRIEPLSEKEHAAVYDCLNRSQFWTSLNHSELTKEEILKIDGDPHGYLQAKLKEIDPSYEAAFIPRALYEMFYLNRAVDEDVAIGNISYLFDQQTKHAASLEASYLNQFKNDKLHFRVPRFAPGLTPKREELLEIEKNTFIRDIHLRINNMMLDFILQQKLNPSQLTFDNIKLLTEAQIAELAECSEVGTTERASKIARLVQKGGGGNGITLNLARSMPVNNDKAREIIRKAVKIECSRLAHTHVLFYRGGIRKKDRSSGTNGGGGDTFALSFGAGLFAGSIWDDNACAFNYMRSKGNDAMMVPVKKRLFRQKDPLIRVPATNTILQNLGGGETFHGRLNIDNLNRKDQHLRLKTVKGTTIFAAQS